MHFRAQVKPICTFTLEWNGCLLSNSLGAGCDWCSGYFERAELTRLRLGIDAGGIKLRGWIIMLLYCEKAFSFTSCARRRKDETSLDFFRFVCASE